MNIFKISLSISRAKTFALLAKFFVAVVFIAAFQPVAYATNRYWDPSKRGSSSSPIGMASSYWATSPGGSYNTSLVTYDDIYFSNLLTGDYYLSLSSGLPLISNLYIDSQDSSVNLTGENSAYRIGIIRINSGTLNLYNGLSSKLNISSITITGGTLRLTNVGNLGVRSFSDISISPSDLGAAKIIFGALGTSTNANRNTFTYDNQGTAATHRISANSNLVIEVEEYVDLAIKGVYTTAGYPRGSAISSNETFTLNLGNNSSLQFEGNEAISTNTHASGGAVYAGGALTMNVGNNSSLQFEGNKAISSSDSADARGGAIYTYSDLTINIGDKSTINFSGNESSSRGGAVCAEGTLLIKGVEGSSNFSVTFDGNSTSLIGGAVYSGRDVEFHNAVFTNNTAQLGGAVYARGNVKFTIDANLGKLISSGNTATDYGSGFICFDGSTLDFDIGSGSEYIIGGADTSKDDLYAGSTAILIKQGAGVLTLNSNSSCWYGNIELQEGTLNINNTFGDSYLTTVTLKGGLLNLGNGANSLLNAKSIAIGGGALRLTNVGNLGVRNFSDITIPAIAEWSKIIFGALGTSTNANRNIFTYDNQGTAATHRISSINDLVIEVEEYVDLAIKGVNYSATSYAYGGAISSEGTLTLNVGNNSSLQFEGNKATSTDSYTYGAATYTRSALTLNVGNNSSLQFKDNITTTTNSSANGGAIYLDGALTLNVGNNSSLQFEGNKATSTNSYAYGGAIYSRGALTMNIGDESTINFSGNESSSCGGAIYSNRALTIKGAEGSSNFSITFDGNSSSNGGAVYSDGNAEFHNAVFTNNTANRGGAIYTYGNVKFTIDANLGTLTSSGNTSNYSNGGFIYMESSSTTLDFDIGSGSEYIIGGADTSKDGLYASSSSTATLIKQGTGVLTLNSNSSYWSGNLEVQAGTLNINDTFGYSTSTAVTLSGGLLNLGNGANSRLNAKSLTMDNNAALRLTNQGNLGGISFSSMTISPSVSRGSKIIFGALETSTNENRNVITYDNQGTAATHKIFTNNNLVIEVEEYVDLTFKGVNSGTYNGGAIYTNGTLQIKGAEGSSNFSVTFDGNSAADGGAVYSVGNAEFHNVVFTNNTAYRGGAIYADGNVKFTIDANLGALTSSGNTATYYNSGGFIYMSGLNKTLSFNIRSGSEYIIGGADTTKDGLISSSSTATLIKDYLGVLTLNSNSSNWLGNLEVQAGTLNINNTFGDSTSTAVTLSGGLLNLGNGANSLLRASSITITDGALRLTNTGNLVGKNFSDIIISSRNSGASKIIFGALGTSTNENRNTFTYDNQGTASTHRISADNNLAIEVEENVDLIFKGVNSSAHGGAIYADGTLQIKGVEGSSNFSVSFDGNSASSGGAVYSGGDAEFHNAVFTNNTANRGGAIYARGNVKFTIDANLGTLTSSGNTSNYSNSGFIYMLGSGKTLDFDIGSGSEYIIGGIDTTKDGLYASSTTATLTKQGAGVLTLNSNSYNWLGNLEVQAGTLNINDTFGNYNNTEVTLSGGLLNLGNGASSWLRAKLITMDNATLRLTNEGNLGRLFGGISFSDITISSSDLGASKIIFGALETSTNENRNAITYDNQGYESTHRISTDNNLAIEVEENVDLTFKGVNPGGSNGGAIYALGTLQIKGAEGSSNFSVSFDGNSSGGEGGAVYSYGDAEFHNAVFTNNTAFNGGAIYAEGNVKFTIDANLGSLTSSGNTALIPIVAALFICQVQIKR